MIFFAALSFFDLKIGDGAYKGLQQKDGMKGKHQYGKAGKKIDGNNNGVVSIKGFQIVLPALRFSFSRRR